MAMISKDEAAEIMTQEERGREFSPQPGTGIESGVVVRIWYEDDGVENWVIEPSARPGVEVVSRGVMNRARLVKLAAKSRGVSDEQVRLWIDA